jgi:hypothetical protein
MTTLKELAAMLDAATGPSRELDCSIFQVLSGPRWARVCVPKTVNEDGWLWQHDETGATTKEDPYTSSIDTALSLVERLLPGWAFNVCFRDDGDTTGDEAGWSVEFRRPYEWLPFSTAPTAPLAILKALVAAMIAQEKTDD